jgi:putative membrane protein
MLQRLQRYEEVLMRSMNVWILAGAVMAGAAACGGDDAGDRAQTGSTPSSGGAPVATTGAAAGGTFVQDQLAVGRKQHGLAELAAERATRPEVKALAQSIASDHAATYADLRQMAQDQTVAEPEQLRTERERLSQLSGEQFDREYLVEMIADHERAVTALEEASRSGESRLREWAAGALPTIRRHLEEAKRLHGGSTQSR